MKMFLKQFSPNPKVRKKASWHYVREKAHRYGFPIYKHNLIWLRDAEFMAVRKQWGNIPGMPEDRGFFLYSTARTVAGVQGDTADIGVRYGSSSFYILNGLADVSRQHHLFDSFEGLSQPTASDEGANKKTHWKAGDIAVDESQTRANLSMFSNCSFYKGWVPTRFAEVADRRFAFVHVDVDLYQPTLETLQFFYERMNIGGVIVCDDYGFASCPGAKKAVDEFFAGKEMVFHIPTGQSLVIKSK